ncbi:MAG: toll/interleukin-1 receptor domain-containing protein [Acidimicrobiales bacterium]
MGSGRVFISYSRRDQAAVTRIGAELDQLGQEVWIDQELSGGQRWWDAILERIRGCDCFIFALSEASVKSRACRAELDYAHQLGRAILPVAVGPAVPDQLLPPVLAETQRVQADAPMQLARALLSLPATRPLPDPLPEPPGVPVSYLDHLSDAVGADHLTVAEQQHLLGSIKPRLRDPEEREAAVALLQRLRLHADINAWVAEEIDGELAKVQVAPSSTPAPSAQAAPPPAQPQQPPPGPPPGQPHPRPQPPPQYYPPPQPQPPPPRWAHPRPSPVPPVRRTSRVGWWLAGIGLVLLLGLGGCIAAVVIGSAELENQRAELRAACGAGDMGACDELFRVAPSGSDDELFGATCGGLTNGEFPGLCDANLGS